MAVTREFDIEGFHRRQASEQRRAAEDARAREIRDRLEDDMRMARELTNDAVWNAARDAVERTWPEKRK